MSKFRSDSRPNYGQEHDPNAWRALEFQPKRERFQQSEGKLDRAPQGGSKRRSERAEDQQSKSERGRAEQDRLEERSFSGPSEEIRKVELIKKAYPNRYDDDSYFCISDYDPLLRTLAPEILLQVDDGDYQGDSRVLFRDGDRFGLLKFGWGSCSGCDALQACGSWEEVSELRDGLLSGIRWDSAAGLYKYITEKDWETEALWHADSARFDEFLTKAKDILGGGKPNLI